MKTRYRAALNNYLTLAAEKGVVVLWVYLVLALSLVTVAGVFAYTRQSVFMLGVMSCQVVYLVSGFFTFSLSNWYVTGFFGFLVLISTIHATFALCKDPRYRTICGQSVLFSVVVATCAITLILSLGSAFLARMPTRVALVSIPTKGAALSGVIIRPQRPTNGQVLFFLDEGGLVVDHGKFPLRGLAEMGYTVISFDCRGDGMDGLSDALAITRWVRTNLSPARRYLAGSGIGARLAILVACTDELSGSVNSVAAINATAEWPFPELAPIRNIGQLSAPLLILHGDEDPLPVEQACLLEDACNEHGKSTRRMIIRNCAQYLGDSWPLICDEMHRFFLASP